MRQLKTTDQNFKKEFKKILERGESLSAGVEETVFRIINDVRRFRNKTLFQYTHRFDEWVANANNLLVTKEEIQKAYKQVSAEDIKALKLAVQRIKNFHQKITLKSWEMKEGDGLLGQRIVPLQRVGVYVPGGKAAYPSSVLMNVVPAKVAGVNEVVMVTPFHKGECSPHVLVAADLAEVDQIYKIGGAQSIAALAYGTETIPKVDKIVGPGNIYVATAKKFVFGQVDIDMIAGPSEIAVVCDGQTDPSWIAADLLSQAEHDEESSAVLFTWDEKFMIQVDNAVKKTLHDLPRAAIAEKSLKNHGALILTQNATEAIELVNEFAPEHLELAVKNPKALLKNVRNAGAIFLGSLTTESFGDYMAGPNHVLPTGGAARFSSPLSTLDFLKASSVIECDAKSIKKFGPQVLRMANMEGLQAHALAMQLRLFSI